MRALIRPFGPPSPASGRRAPFPGANLGLSIACGAISGRAGCWRTQRERDLRPRGEAPRLGARSVLGGDETVIAVEFPDDFDDAVDSLEVGARHRRVGDEQGFIQSSDLHGEEFGWRLRHALGEDLLNQRPHPLRRHVLARRDLGNGNARVQQCDDPFFPIDLPEPRRPPCTDRPVAPRGGNIRGFGVIGRWVFSFTAGENKDSTIFELSQENVLPSAVRTDKLRKGN
jgi:hypothetical protein